MRGLLFEDDDLSSSDDDDSDETPTGPPFGGYPPTTPNEIAFVKELETKRSDTINHLFILPSVSPILRLPPIHWAIHLDIPPLVGWIASHSSGDLKIKIKGGRDVIDVCFSQTAFAVLKY
jgi:hypothetical protein